MIEREDFGLFAFAFAMLTLIMSLIIWLVLYTTHDVAGTVNDKYFEAEHEECGKTCYDVPDCWTIKVDTEWFLDDSECVSKARYDTINVGDYFTE